MRHSSSRTAADRHGNGMSRSVMEEADDTKFMQEVQISLFDEEVQKGIERFVQYGFTAVPKKPSDGGSGGGTGSGEGGGQSSGGRKAAEAIFSFLGGNRSHGIAMMVGDRRFRLYKLKEGEVALHDDQGHQIHLSRDGIVISSPNSKKVVHQVMTADEMPKDAEEGQVAQKDREVVAQSDQNKDGHEVKHTKTINHNVAQSITQGASAASNIASQINGMIAQAQALVTAGVGLPGINSIGSQISALASAVTGEAASVASSIASLANSMATSNMAGMSSLLSSMTPLASQLSSLMNPQGIEQALHEHILDLVNGVKASAFQGAHTTLWNPGGVSHASSQNVSSTAPQLPHNGNILGSDNLVLTKIMTAANYSTVSDARLKSNIEDFPSALERGLQIKFKTFLKRHIFTNDQGESSIHDDDPEPSFGVIAQDFELIFPEMVREVNGFKTVDEPKFGIVAIAMLQEFIAEQRQEIADLKSQISALQNK